MQSKLFDPITAPLTGINLIEASAGTGKTWSLATLFVRFLLGTPERSPLPIDKILVVTFTKAATAELCIRFQNKIKETIEAFDGMHDHLDSLIASYCLDERQKKLSRSRLVDALNQFDKAAIYTIHGFCQHFLSYHAPQAAHFSIQTLLSDEELLLKEMADDFWRSRVLYDSQKAKLAVRFNWKADSLLKEIAAYIGRPYLQKPTIQSSNIEISQQALSKAFEVFLGYLDEGMEVFWNHHECLRQNVYKKHIYETFFVSLKKLISTYPVLSKDEIHALSNLTPDSISKNLKKGTPPLEHPFFAIALEFLEQYKKFDKAIQEASDALRFEMIRWIDEKLADHEGRKKRRLDDLVNDLVYLLKINPNLGSELSDIWQVALIDEFQDTDPMQYYIFECSFMKHNRPLFLVGDPKQAIYSFRGADIFTYFSAKEKATHYYTLTHNYRASLCLVQAVNALFDRPRAFWLDIPFLPAKATIQNGQLKDGYPAIVWHWLESDRGQTHRLSLDKAQTMAADLTAKRVANLLASHVLIEGDKGSYGLRGCDIAILVVTNAQASLMREALKKVGIPSLSSTSLNVFSSPQALNFLTLMKAWLNPEDEGLQQAALLTKIIALDEVLRLGLGEVDGAKYRALFFEAHRYWKEDGLMAAWRFYSSADELSKKLLLFEEGERWLINLTHLVELAHQEALSQHYSMQSLVSWFEEQIERSYQKEEIYYERLESNKDLVRIVTIHSAKGMQYPIVFCPFLWYSKTLSKPRQSEAQFLLYHEGNKAYLTTETFADDSAKQSAHDERFAEHIRLLYVALTRAKFRIEIYWGCIVDVEKKALSWLLAEPDQLPHELVYLPRDCFSLRISQYPQHCFAGPEEYSEPLLSLPKEHHESCLRVLPSMTILPAWSVTSFSGLCQAHSRISEIVFGETIKEKEKASLKETTAKVDFPKGLLAGRCLHEILQQADFQGSKKLLFLVIDQALIRFGFNPTLWRETAYDLVRGALDTPLNNSVCLKDIAANQCLKEMDFLLPLSLLKAKQLRHLLTNPDYGLHPAFQQTAHLLNFEDIQGYLKGFIDLVVQIKDRFYVIDYKLHHLGDRIQNYAPTELVVTISKQHYYLQYLIYLIAVRTYLRSRGLSAAIGGVHYLFLRGLDASGNGVWSDCPSEKLLVALETLFVVH